MVVVEDGRRQLTGILDAGLLGPSTEGWSPTKRRQSAQRHLLAALVGGKEEGS